MRIKIAVVGSRGPRNEDWSYDFEGVKYIDLIESTLRAHERFPEIDVISGGARGIDTAAASAARHRLHVGFFEYKAKWLQYGKAAGPIRNGLMAKDCDEAIAFWDGSSPGTMNMVKQVRALGKKATVIML